MVYGVYDKILNPDIKKDLEEDNFCLAKNNAYPDDNLFVKNCVKKRLTDVGDKYKTLMYSNASTLIYFFHLFKYIQKIEKTHKNDLISIAISTIKQDFNIPDDEVIFDLEITDHIKLPSNIKNDESKTPIINNLYYDVNDEIQKRRFINALISGAAKKGHYIFNIINDKLNRISPNLCDNYKTIMVVNDISYYMFGNNLVNNLNSKGNDKFNAGFVHLSFAENGTPKITVKAANFVVLLHELIKGVMELVATLALPDDKEVLKSVYEHSDYIKAEIWYLRLGPVFWENLISCFPPEHSDKKLQILGKIFELPTNEFNLLMKNALSNEDKAFAKNRINDFVKEIKSLQ